MRGRPRRGARRRSPRTGVAPRCGACPWGHLAPFTPALAAEARAAARGLDARHARLAGRRAPRRCSPRSSRRWHRRRGRARPRRRRRGRAARRSCEETAALIGPLVAAAREAGLEPGPLDAARRPPCSAGNPELAARVTRRCARPRPADRSSAATLDAIARRGAPSCDAEPRFPAAAFAALAADGALAPDRRRRPPPRRRMGGRARGRRGRRLRRPALRGPSQRRRAARASPPRSRCAPTSSPPSRAGGCGSACGAPTRCRARASPRGSSGRRRLARREGVLLRRRRARPRARARAQPRGGPPRLAYVDLEDARGRPRRGSARGGMRASESHRVRLPRRHGPRAARASRASSVREPWFSRDAMRTAAAWAGIADAPPTPRSRDLARAARARRPAGARRRRASPPRARRSTAGSSTAPRAPTRSRTPPARPRACSCAQAIADAGRDDPRRGRARVRLAPVRHRHAAGPRAPRLRAVRPPAPARPDARARRPRALEAQR